MDFEPTQTQEIEIGRLLRASTAGFVVGCRVTQLEAPAFGALVRAPLLNNYHVYGIIHDIRIEDDGLVRQLITAEGVDEAIIADNRMNRNVPVEISVLALGYRQGQQISHLLPPQPPLSLDSIYLCSPADLVAFTGAGRLGYLRHLLRSRDLPIGELLAAHLHAAAPAHEAAGNLAWKPAVMQELIALLRDDYSTLTAVLGALGEIVE